MLIASLPFDDVSLSFGHSSSVLAVSDANATQVLRDNLLRTSSQECQLAAFRWEQPAMAAELGQTTRESAPKRHRHAQGDIHDNTSTSAHLFGERRAWKIGVGTLRP